MARTSMLCTHLSLGECLCMKKGKRKYCFHRIPKRAVKKEQEESTITYDVQNVCTHLTMGVCLFCAKFDDTRKKRRHNIEQEEEKEAWGNSTALMMYDDPWKIKKILKDSDLGNLSRLLISKDIAEKLVLPVLSVEAQSEAKTGKATQIMIWDVDTNSMHHLMFKLWGSSKSYIFLGNWNHDFVKRRDLKKGDEIGLHWNPYNNCFNFSVLLRA